MHIPELWVADVVIPDAVAHGVRRGPETPDAGGISCPPFIIDTSPSMDIGCSSVKQGARARRPLPRDRTRPSGLWALGRATGGGVRLHLRCAHRPDRGPAAQRRH